MSPWFSLGKVQNPDNHDEYDDDGDDDDDDEDDDDDDDNDDDNNYDDGAWLYGFFFLLLPKHLSA